MMKNKELITYLLDFKMDADVVYVNRKGEKEGITTDPFAYLGNGKVDSTINEVKLMSNKTMKKKEYTIHDFSVGDHVIVSDPNNVLYGRKGTVIGKSDKNGGNMLFSNPDTVGVMLIENGKSFVEKLSIHSILKVADVETIGVQPRTYFISGHRDITQEEFDWYYLPILDKTCDDPNCCFVVGDCDGVDIMAQVALADMVDPSRVTVYHMFAAPRNLACAEFNLKGGYKSDDERDSAMTHDSTDDIAWIRKGKEKSGTAQNILRRCTMAKNN